jgi:hypothetical protein
VGAKEDHLLWASEHAALAERLSDGDEASKRWAVVLAYYSVLHTVSAIADERLGEHPEDHYGTSQVPTRADLPEPRSLEARIKESYAYANRGRYLRGSNSKAATWFTPSSRTPTEIVRMALELMTSLNEDLARAVGWDD